MTEAEVLKVIEDNPGSSGFQIHRAISAQSRAVRWFGQGSFMAALLGPGVSSMYVHLASMERRGIITSNWGVATPERGGRRPRHYYARAQAPAPIPHDGEKL